MKLLGLFILALFILKSSALWLSKPSQAAYRTIREKSSFHRLWNQKISQSTDKVRVKLLQDTPQGKKNDIVMISHALWNNVILPKKLGVRITDEALAEIQQQAAEQAAKELEFSYEFVKKLITPNVIAPISKKIGSNGQLFGSVNIKAIVEQIKKCITGYDLIIDSKTFSVTGVYEYGSDGSISKAQNLAEIRKAGKYRIRVKVHPKIEEAEFDLTVGA